MTFVDCDGMCQVRDCLLDASPPGALAREISRISGTVAESGTCTLTCAVLSMSLCERRVIWCSTVGALPREPPRGLNDALVVCARHTNRAVQLKVMNIVRAARNYVNLLGNFNTVNVS